MKLCLACREQFTSVGWECPSCDHTPESRYGHLAFSPELAESNNGFSADYFTDLAPLEAGNFWFKSRNRLLIWALSRFFPKAQSFLEIGCGTGFVLSGMQKEFPEMLLSGSEIFSAGLAFAKRRLPEADLFQMDARSIPFACEFDVIGAFDVLEHIDDDNAVLLQMFQAARPGGGILLTVPQHPFLWSQSDDYAFHKRRYTRKELIKKVTAAGFKVHFATSFLSLLLPLMFLSRLKLRSQADFDPLAELNVGPLLNTTMEKVLEVERKLIKRGFSFPAGGSLFIVAKRDSIALTS